MASRKSARRPSPAASSPVRLFLDSQAVIALRLMKIAEGGQGAFREASRMITEKFEAALAAQLAAGAAIIGGHADSAMASATSVYGRKVRANRRRLTR